MIGRFWKETRSVLNILFLSCTFLACVALSQKGLEAGTLVKLAS